MNEVIVSRENVSFKIKYWHLFLFNFVFLLLCYLPNLHVKFCADSYVQIWYMNSNLSNGRFASYFLDLIQRNFSNPVLHQQYYLIANICILSLDCLVLIKIHSIYLQKTAKLWEIIFVDFCFLLGFVNIAIEEFYYFPEMYLQYALGLFFASLALYSFFINKSYILSFICLFISLCFYQICAQEYCVFIILFALMKHKYKLSKPFLGDIVFSTLIFGLANFLDAICMRLYSSDTRLKKYTFQALKEQFNVVVSSFYSYLKNPFGTVIGIMFYLIIIIVLSKCIFFMYKKRYRLLLVSFLFGLISTAVIFVLQMVMLGICPMSRTLIGLGFILSSLLLVADTDTNRIISLICLIFTFVINIYYVSLLSINQFASTKLDQELTCNIYHRICDYEQKNKIKIDKVSFCNDKYVRWHHESVDRVTYTVKSFVCEWGLVPMLNYYSHRDFKKIDMPRDIYEKYFYDKDWDYYIPEEQLVFIDDTLYICVY